ncbi:23S rRNA (uracil(1939)-C(5))-methyltransferase RlmD [Marininema halotolerans]|uniref:tRNA (Uracil-5-)-methyltransferase/23S rRNA (Uracil1939-C5)-methyltransferase n=1 Tax=Marininema halotolerans TaxID=1155944 RepID=A0A1I6Q0N6_9BACL|nr:23S rRNA (uracil(1939)-C(5))-methyltransferase RlmD [Marininema halotolerans]SFS46049.1 tRNA (uracil-5-)-methyltransferase/23S rRNA (uracil1939-C5)-methyltransferase [Marininema halotolerans]
MKLKQGQVIRLPIRRIGINGEGVGYYQKQVVFVEEAIPGEYVSARITEVKKKFARGEILRIQKRSSHRISAPCPIYRQCGGCQLQHIDYPMQLRLKRELVEEAFSRYADRTPLPIQETLGMEEPWAYRNKAQLPVQRQGGRIVMGMYSPSSHRLIDMKGCMVQHPETNQILDIARQTLTDLSISIYDEGKHRGAIRNVVVRYGFETKEAQLVLISKEHPIPKEDELQKELVRRLPQLVSLVVNHNPQRTSLIFGEQSRVIWGQETMAEELGGRTYHLSAPAFFQLNPNQTSRLYEKVATAAGLTGKETVVDAYCGTGTIGLWLANQAARVIGMDTVAEAIADAKMNAKANHIDHAEYHVGAAEDLLPQWIAAGFRPDVVVADPPRTGLGEAFIQTLLRTQIPRFVYVSCNPSTLAKDCSVLLKGGYQVRSIQPVDMFPQTSQVESVVVLDWKRDS